MESLDGNGDSALQQQIVKALIDLDSRLTPFERDYVAIAEFEGTSVDEAKRKWGSTEVNGPESALTAAGSIQVSGNSVCIHWYSGTTPEELQQYLETICRVSGFSVYDPQDMTIHRHV